MKWIGLTGGIATGKSTVAQILCELGVPVVDADRIVHRLLSEKGEAYSLVVNLFGKSILNQDSTIDRKKLGSIVFNEPEQLRQLESVLHPLVQSESQKEKMRLEEKGCELAFYEIPLLFEKNLEGRFDKTILVYAPKAIQKQRLMQRNQLNEIEADQRLAVQLSIEDKVDRADLVIKNESSLADLKKEVVEVLKKLSEETTS